MATPYGRVIIESVGANLKVDDLILDSYVIFTFGKKSRRTPTIFHNTNPEFPDTQFV